MEGRAGRLLASVVALGALGAVGLVPGGNSARPVQAQTTVPISFSSAQVVDSQREGGEPDIAICGPSATWSFGNCGHNNPYASAPYGFSTTSSWLWRSEDGGQTFKLTPSNNTTGKPDACPGGGDTDLQVSPGTAQFEDYLNFIDLQGLTNFSTGVSRNGGQTFTCDPASSLATIVDRQWFGIYKNPAGATSNNGSIVYVDYDLVAGQACLTASGSAGNEFVVQSSTDGGLTYGPTVTADCNDGIAGNIEVNQTTGEVFAGHTSYANPAAANTADAVTVDSSTDHGATWTRHVVYACHPTSTSDCTTGQDFAVMAMDTQGGLYMVWSQAPTDASGTINGPSHIYYSYSGDNANTWTAPVQVDHSSTNVDLFPWVAAGQPGKLDIVWYGTTKSGAATGWDPGSQASNWYPYMAQIQSAQTGTPSISAPIQVSRHSNHYGGICTMGLGCTTGGDRSLADFFQVAIDSRGLAHVVWTDTSNNSNTSASGNESGLVYEAQQISGPSLLGTTLTGGAATCSTYSSTPCVRDPIGDARYEANGIIGPNVPKLDLTGATLNLDPSNSNDLAINLKVAALGSLPGPTDTGIMAGDNVIDYLVTWNYHVPGHTDAQYDATGNIYYAYFEVNRLTGQVSAYDGDTCSLSTTKAKYFVYPGQHAIPANYNLQGGTITMLVPRTDVGNPPLGARFYEVTAQTVGQSGPAGPYTCTTRDPNGNPTDPSGQIFNVYDKTTSFTAILPSTATAARR